MNRFLAAIAATVMAALTSIQKQSFQRAIRLRQQVKDGVLHGCQTYIKMLA